MEFYALCVRIDGVVGNYFVFNGECWQEMAFVGMAGFVVLGWWIGFQAAFVAKCAFKK